MVASVERKASLDALRLKAANLSMTDGVGTSLGAFMNAVKMATRNDNLLAQGGPLEGYTKALADTFPSIKAASGLNLSFDPDGGILVPPALAEGVWRSAVSEGLGILPRLRKRTVPTIKYAIPRWSEIGNSRAAGSRNGGVRFAYVNEGDQVSGVTPKLGNTQGYLSKIVCQIAATDELLQDTPDLAGELNRVVSEELGTTLTDIVVNESKAGRPQGLLKAASKIAVAKETSQTAATVNVDNIRKMRARLYSKLWGDGCWLVNPELVSQLAVLDMPSTDTTAARVVQFIEPTTRPGQPFALIDGLPAFACEECPAPGTEGDIILCAPSTIEMAARSLIPDFRASMHLKFLTSESVFQWTMRLDTVSLWPAAITPLYGTDTVSNIVTLATRS